MKGTKTTRSPTWTPFPQLVIYPTFLYVVIFLLLPIGYLPFLSLSSTDQFTKVSQFRGLTNYGLLMHLYWRSLQQTVIFAAARLVAIVPLSLLIALEINQVKFLRGFYTLAYFSPVVTSTAAVALIWSGSIIQPSGWPTMWALLLVCRGSLFSSILIYL